MSTNPDPIDRTGRPFDLVHADYYHGTADELMEGDGVRLCPHPSHPVPADLIGALVVVHIELVFAATDETPALYLVEVIGREAMVSDVLDEALFDLPAGGTHERYARLMAADERVLIRG